MAQPTDPPTAPAPPTSSTPPVGQSPAAPASPAGAEPVPAAPPAATAPVSPAPTPAARPPAWEPPPPTEARTFVAPRKARNDYSVYFSIGPSLSYTHASLSASNLPASASASGTGLGFDMTLGMGATPQLVLGGMYSYHGATDSSTKLNSGASTSSSGMSLDIQYLAFVVEYFFKNRPFHIGAGIGEAFLHIERLTVGPLPPTTPGGTRGYVDASSMSGIYGHVQLGVRTSMSPYWSFEALFRLSVGNVSDSDAFASALTVNPSVGLAFSYYLASVGSCCLCALSRFVLQHRGDLPMSIRPHFSLISLFAALTIFATDSQDAAACGGTFCDVPT
ncbi:MAG: hypothetical protein U0165_02780, partial [Polyangiaceae bacterium]